MRAFPFVATLALLAALSAHPAHAQFEPRIVNGLVTWEPPSVGMIACPIESGSCNDYTVDPLPGPPIASCSGTLIGCRTFLTAAHCVCEGDGFWCNEIEPRDPSRYEVLLQHAGLFSVESVSVHPDFSRQTGWPNDVAILRLAEPVEGIEPMALNRLGFPPFGTPGTQVGFGNTSWPPGAPGYLPDRGIKRAGDVVTVDCATDWPDAPVEGHVCTRFEEPIGPPGEDSAPCQGDSGGPIVVDLGAGPVVASVASGRTRNELDPPDAFGCGPPRGHINQDVFWHLDFIEAEAGADLGSVCGAYPTVGEPPTESFGFWGSVSPGKPDERHTFDVPAGTSVLRVVLNGGASGAGADTDVYAKAGAAAEVDHFDCAVAEEGQFGSCEVVSPTPGTWHLLVSQVAEEGEYQVTAVAVPEPAHALLLVTGALVLLGRHSIRLARARTHR